MESLVGVLDVESQPIIIVKQQESLFVHLSVRINILNNLVNIQLFRII